MLLKPIHFTIYLGVIPVHVELVAFKNIGTLVDVLDGKPDGRHDTMANESFRAVRRSHGEECSKVDVGAVMHMFGL